MKEQRQLPSTVYNLLTTNLVQNKNERDIACRDYSTRTPNGGSRNKANINLNIIDDTLDQRAIR